MNTNFKPLYKQIAEKLIEELRAGTSPFQKPWREAGSNFTLPLNPTTGKNYRGMNALWLSMQGRDDPRWMTLKQASYNHWSVETGAKATLISFVKTTELQPLTDEHGMRLIGENGRPQTRTVKLDSPLITNAWVFNAEQIRGIPPLQNAQAEKAGQRWNPIARAEKILTASGAAVAHGGNEAFYDLSQDRIQVPSRQQFESAGQYYATLLHELGHWTGHETRMNRDMAGGYGSEDYAREELRAEIASLMLGSELEIGHHFGQHAAYVDAWISVLENEPLELHLASRDAQKIFDYVLGIEQKRELERAASPGQDSTRLAPGQVIGYNATAYKVLEVGRGKNAQIEDLETGARLKVGPKDGLYSSLLKAAAGHLPQVKAQPQIAAENVYAEKETIAPRIKR
jgi:antirestriction protein ArdC